MTYLLNHSHLSLFFFFISLSHRSLVSSTLTLQTIKHLCLDEQRSALLQLQQDLLNHSSASASFPGPSSSKVESWDLKTDCCSWKGVTCDSIGRVIGLDLSYSNLSGGLNSIFGLHYLQQLNLAGNDFGLNPIPSGFDRLGNLTHLNLSMSCFSDQIPLEISRLTRLRSLDLSTRWNCYHHPLNGSEEPEFEGLNLINPNLEMFVHNLSLLEELNLEGVNISTQGTNWCEVISNALPNLRVLSLSECGLSGPICSSFSKLGFLSELDLSWNQLSSVEPNFLANSSHVVTLNLAGCELHGSFPPEVFLLPKLQQIDISNNPLLTGQLPEFPSNNTIQFLSLVWTNFYGKLPYSISNLKFLKYLDLEDCKFSGLVPSSLANLTQLEVVVLDRNNFKGPIPHFQQDGVPNLASLLLYHNQLDGMLHSSLFTLPSLQVLDLGWNEFSGELNEFPNASSLLLENLYLGGNNLRGPIPRSIFELPKLKLLYLGGNNFSGTVKLDIFKNQKNLMQLDLFGVSIEADNRSLVLPQFEELQLSSCNLTEFPNFLKTQNRLVILNLSNNQIQGYVPSWIWNTTVIMLDLSSNPIDFPKKPLLGVVDNGKPFSNDHTNSFYLSWLETLRMRSCHVSSIPEILKNQTGLKSLDLSDNKISGQIPNWICNFSQVYLLDMSHNSLYGQIPDCLGNIASESISNLVLELSHNQLEGSIPLVNFSQLYLLDMSHNNLYGQIPDFQGNIQSLTVLDLRGNKFTSMTSSFAQASELKSLRISGNKLEGRLPRSLANCSNLEVLDLGDNFIHDTFPFWLTKLPQLKILVLRANKFFGQIGNLGPVNNFPKLHILDLSSNEFTGYLPQEFIQSLVAMHVIGNNKYEPKYVGEDYKGYYKESLTIMSKGMEMYLERILTIFTSIDLSNNRFHGKIPGEIRYLKSLKVLNLSQNSFIGQIPSSLGELTELESLDLSQNQLSGEIPQQLKSLTFLAVMNLSYNHLEGNIPQGNQFNTFSNSSYEGNFGLCGWPLTRKCGEASEATQQHFEEEISWINGIFDWKIVLMGYGCGLVIGFSVGYMILSNPRNKWCANLERLGRRHGRRFKLGQWL